MELIQESFSPRPETSILQYVYDIRAWLQDEKIEGLHNIVYPHCFKLFKCEDGNVKLKYKNWSNDDIWLPTDSDGINILKV